MSRNHPQQNQKDQLANTFDTDLGHAALHWMTDRVAPYSRCYTDAYAWRQAILAQRSQALAAERAALVETFTAVSLVVGAAVLPLAPVSALLSGGRQAAIRVFASIQRASYRLGITAASAWRAVARFTLGRGPELVERLLTGPVKDLIKSNYFRPMSSGQTSLTGGGGNIPQGSWVRGSPPGTTAVPPLMYYLDLHSIIDYMRMQLGDLALFLRDHDDVGPDELSQILDAFRQGPFLSIPRHQFSELAPINPVELANGMERCLWALWVPTLRREVHTYQPIPGSLSTRPVVETVYDRPHGIVEERLQQLGIRIRTSSGQEVSAGRFFGWRGEELGPVTTEREIRLLIRWGTEFLDQETGHGRIYQFSTEPLPR